MSHFFPLYWVKLWYILRSYSWLSVFTLLLFLKESRTQETVIDRSNGRAGGLYAMVVTLHACSTGKTSRRSRFSGRTDAPGQRRWLVTQVTTAHFRPNFVVGGVRAHEEDGWTRITIGDALTFRVTGPCGRCANILQRQSPLHRSC